MQMAINQILLIQLKIPTVFLLRTYFRNDLGEEIISTNDFKSIIGRR